MAKKKKKSTLSQLTPKQKELTQQLKQLTRFCVREGTLRAKTELNPSDELEDLFTKRQLKLAKEYYRTGIETSIIGLPEEEVMSDNIIKLPADGLPDTVDLITNLEKTMDMADLMLFMIPCFETGVLVNPEGPSTTYTHWTVNTINLEKRFYEITLHMYTKGRDENGAVWSPSIRVHTIIDFHDPQKVTQSYVHEDCMGLTDIVTAIPYNKLKWSPFDIEVWKNTMVTLTKTQEEMYPEKYDMEYHENVVFQFTQAMTYVNVLLSQNKAKIKPNPKPADDGERKTQAQFDPEKQAERKVRTIGPVSIRSRSVPHAPTKKSVVKYTMESWNRRGHMRHYKSGKVVYIKPTTPHRHALKNTESKPAPTTLNVRND